MAARLKAGDDLFAHADAASVTALSARGVRFDERDSLATIDLRACGDVEVFGTESGAYFRFSGKLGEVRVILAPAAFFTLCRTFARGPV